MVPLFVANVLAAQEEERLEHIRLENVDRRVMREASDPFSIENVRFVELFRLNKDMAQYVLNGIQANMEQSNNPVSIPLLIKIFGVLSFYASGSYQRVLGQSYNISMSQQSINTFSGEWIRFPRTLQEKQQIKLRFMEARNFPGIIGAVDCTHVEILQPNVEEHNYFNRKGYHSKNIQIICDHDLRILNINAQYGGASHDSFIWRNSLVRNEMEETYQMGDRNSWLLGDSGYPQEPWLMTPFINPLPDTPESRYNASHIQARNCVERCIGVYKARFLCLSKILIYSPEKVDNIANVCAILHNICIRGGLDFDVPQQEGNNGNNIHAPGPGIDVNREGVIARRNVIQRYFA